MGIWSCRVPRVDLEGVSFFFYYYLFIDFFKNIYLNFFLQIGPPVASQRVVRAYRRMNRWQGHCSDVIAGSSGGIFLIWAAYFQKIIDNLYEFGWR